VGRCRRRRTDASRALTPRLRSSSRAAAASASAAAAAAQTATNVEQAFTTMAHQIKERMQSQPTPGTKATIQPGKSKSLNSTNKGCC
jgi:hypothetical protein